MQLTYIYNYIYYISAWSKCKTPGPAHGLRLEDLQFQNDVCLFKKHVQIPWCIIIILIKIARICGIPHVATTP